MPVPRRASQCYRQSADAPVAVADWQGAVLVAVGTGLRLADLAGLTWKDMDMTAGTLTVTPGKTDKPLMQPKPGASIHP